MGARRGHMLLEPLLGHGEPICADHQGLGAKGFAAQSVQFRGSLLRQGIQIRRVAEHASARDSPRSTGGSTIGRSCPPNFFSPRLDGERRALLIRSIAEHVIREGSAWISVATPRGQPVFAGVHHVLRNLRG